MKRLIALCLLAACAAQAQDKTLTVQVDNRTDHSITALQIWEVEADGATVDDALANFDQPIPAQTIGQVGTDMIRCFEKVLFTVTYDDGQDTSQEANLCDSTAVIFSR